MTLTLRQNPPNTGLGLRGKGKGKARNSGRQGRVVGVVSSNV